MYKIIKSPKEVLIVKSRAENQSTYFNDMFGIKEGGKIEFLILFKI